MADDFFEKCKARLRKTWKKIQAAGYQPPAIEDRLRKAMSACINSETKSYRYVLPTQLLAKVVDSTLDATCLQAARGGRGAFDARSLSTKVIVPFDRENESVLGGSPTPYVNNPLRVPEVSNEYRSQQKDKAGWDNLVLVLGKVEEIDSLDFTRAVLENTMYEVYLLLSRSKITYPIPKRISHSQTIQLILDLLTNPSNGDHPLAVSSALFQTMINRFSLFNRISRSKVNASDIATGQVADIDCYRDGSLVLAVEVKDKEITLDDMRDKLPKCREKGVDNLLFITTKGIDKNSRGEIDKLIVDQYAVGLSVYLVEIREFIDNFLTIFDDERRIELVSQISNQLDEYSNYESRKAWLTLLSEI